MTPRLGLAFGPATVRVGPGYCSYCKANLLLLDIYRLPCFVLLAIGLLYIDVTKI